MEKVKQTIINFIRKKIEESGTRGAVIGLSGGIDSSVVATLIKETLGINKCLGIIMPCYSKDQDSEDAFKLCHKFNINYDYINLNKTFDSHSFTGIDKMADGNFKARLRMATLYYVAGTMKYLVIGTGNKTELNIGYCTKWGDNGVDIEPLGDLYKTEVRKLAKYIGIPKSIIKKPPSAGLWENQTDEDELGITYKELDKQLKSENYSKKVWKLIKNSEHKRKTPDYPIIEK